MKFVFAALLSFAAAHFDAQSIADYGDLLEYTNMEHAAEIADMIVAKASHEEDREIQKPKNLFEDELFDEKAIAAELKDNKAPKIGHFHKCNLKDKDNCKRACAYCYSMKPGQESSGCKEKKYALELASTGRYFCSLDKDAELCNGQKEKECNATPECVWCSHAAVGKGCFTYKQADTLPHTHICPKLFRNPGHNPKATEKQLKFE